MTSTISTVTTMTLAASTDAETQQRQTSKINDVGMTVSTDINTATASKINDVGMAARTDINTATVITTSKKN